ncbi:hypothetical protein HPB47_002672 [Ixodes persulcatus]|uniref:Uncharacterized protein n=1 Tax=Ixodes persulcatus TaxID=34615 RepID=A0AC60PLP8_IXOPE|nr:hypothetical protein HPB47_002672 [Ixodes persulcatus]
MPPYGSPGGDKQHDDGEDDDVERMPHRASVVPQSKPWASVPQTRQLSALTGLPTWKPDASTLASGGGGALPKAPRPEMDYVEVAGEDISPEECTAEAGWLVSHRQRGTRALNKLGLTATSTAKNDAGGRTENRKPRQRHRKQRQQPALPREDIKVILRPREGLDVTKVSSARLRDGVFCAIGLKDQEAEGDLLRVNPEKNILVTSTQSMDRAKKYNSISKICIAGKTYEVTAYAAPPEDTSRRPFWVAARAAGERKKGGREIVRAPSLVYPTADQGATTTRDSGSSAGQDLNQDAGALTPKADISQDRHPKAADTRLREKPSRTSSAPQDAKKKISNQTSAQQADRQQQVELTKIKQMLEMLKAEVAKLRGSENADKVVPETQGPSRSQAPPPDQGKANTIQPTQVPLAEDSSSDEMENSEPESPPPKPMLAKFAESIGTQIAALNARVMAIEAISPRFTGGVGGTGPMKSTKPYARPQEGLSLVTDHAYPTRLGNSVCADTTPDLTFTKNSKNEAEWLNTQENLGSDHYIVATKLEAGPQKPKKGTQLKIIEWDEFRELRAAELEQLHTSVQKATKTIPEEAELTQADAKLLHMWEAKQGLQKRLGKQKLNRALRRRLVILNKTIEDYANQLSRQNWHSTCDGMELQMGLARTWNILRYLIDPDKSKTTQKHNLSQILHTYQFTNNDLIKAVRNRYIGNNPKEQLRIYAGASNDTLDHPFTTAEARGAILGLRTNSVPGPDGVTNKMLRNLDDDSIEALTKYMNKCWKDGKIPTQWKTAKVIMIPKPGKKLQLDTLRPISLTSCVGKLMEHIVLNRLNKYMDEKGLFPHTMIGFRPKLSTQDVMLRLQHQIIDGEECSPLDTRAIVGLDLTKAFDNVKHAAILENLEKLEVGQKTYDYIRDFLSDRTVTLTVGGVESGELELGSRGTPQGFVLSPFLFNVAMIGLPSLLEEIHGLNHSLYADDVTLWVAGGSDGHVQDTLQQAINAVEGYVEPKGLSCSPQKSELLLYRPTRRGQKKEATTDKPQIQLYACGGLPIPVVHCIRVLGLKIQENGHNIETIRTLEKSVYQTTRLISRIANRHHGMKEGNLIRLVQAFVLSRVTYVAPFLDLKADERKKINALIKRAYKQAIGIPITTSNARFEALGLHNTLDELVEAQRIAQMERLTKSPTGRHILQTLNINCEGRLGEKHDIPPDIRGHIHIPPLPRNMHPEHNTERRQARAQALDKRFAHLEDVVYVDAADYSSRDAMAISVVDRQGKLINSGTVFTTSSEVGEEAAIALAMTSSSRIKFIVSDSKPAILNYTRGRISSEALKILRTGLHGDRVRGVLIVWAPAHSGLPGNENAHDAARGLTDRADVTNIFDAHSFRRSDRDRLVAYRDVINHYRLGRAKYPAADRTLSKWQAVAWRLLQTNTFPNTVAYSRCYPGLYSSACKHCGDRADLQHMVWACPFKKHRNDTNRAQNLMLNIRTSEQWETVLLSSDPREQVRLVQMAEAAAKEQELLAAD